MWTDGPCGHRAPRLLAWQSQPDADHQARAGDLCYPEARVRTPTATITRGMMMRSHSPSVDRHEHCWNELCGRRHVSKVVSLIFVCLAFMSPVKVVGQELAPAPSASGATTSVRASVVTQLRSGPPPPGHRRADALTELQSDGSAGQTSKQGGTWFGRHPVLTGALIGAAVGATLGATGGTEPGTSKPVTVAFTAAVGGGVGALIGLVFR
jgi:hypothetical protein